MCLDLKHYMKLQGNLSNKSLLIVNLEKSQISAAFDTKAAGQWRPCVFIKEEKKLQEYLCGV